MWKVIDVQRWFDGWIGSYNLERLTKHAVDLSCGELIDIIIEGFGTDKLLDHIVLHSFKLKRLFLMSCYDMTGSGLSRAVKRAPQLEELHLTFISINTEDIEVIGRNFPQLRSFMVHKDLIGSSIECDDDAFAIANNMPELCHLELFGSDMTNNGLQAILNGCPHLQSLDVRMCHNLDLNGKLGKLCMKQIKDFKHGSGFYDLDDFS